MMHYRLFRAVFPILFITTVQVYAQVDISRLEEIREKAKQGDVRARYQLAQIYEEGKYEKQNLKKAFSLYKSLLQLRENV